MMHVVKGRITRLPDEQMRALGSGHENRTRLQIAVNSTMVSVSGFGHLPTVVVSQSCIIMLHYDSLYPAET